MGRLDAARLARGRRLGSRAGRDRRRRARRAHGQRRRHDIRDDGHVPLRVRRHAVHGHARGHRHWLRQHRPVSAPALLRASRGARESHAGHRLRRSRRSDQSRAESPATLGAVRDERPVRDRVRRRGFRAVVRRALRRQENGRRRETARPIPRRAVALETRMGERPHRGLGTGCGIRRDRLRRALELDLAAGGIHRPRRDRRGQHNRRRRPAVPPDRPRACRVGASHVAGAKALQGCDVGPPAYAGRTRWPAQGHDSRRGGSPRDDRLRPRARVRRDAHAGHRQESRNGRETAVAEAMARTAASMPDRIVHDDSRRRRRAGRPTGHDDGGPATRSRGASKSRASVQAPISGAASSCRFSIRARHPIRPRHWRRLRSR